MAITNSDPRSNPRAIVEQLKRFVQYADAPPTANGFSLSDAGFVLLSLKEQLLGDSPRNMHFCQEFISKPLNGLELLGKVVIVLQGIVNTTQGSGSKLSNLISRTNSSTSRKRKAAVAEADCIECIKILLEKLETAWRPFLESSTGLDAVLFSVNSPQLDSKCYALEILLLLLEQAQGFIILFRALTVLAARNKDYLRLSIFVNQLKHGLHTYKLHIQILIVRLFNKLLSTAPTSTHRNLVKSEAALVNFSSEYVEKLIANLPQTPSGVDLLIEELNVWKSLNSAAAYGKTPTHNSIYGFTEGDTDTSQSERGRRLRTGPIYKYPMSNTTVMKNVEKQRLKKQTAAMASGSGSGSRSSMPSFYETGGTRGSTSYYQPERKSVTLSTNRAWNDGSYSPPPSSRMGYATEKRPISMSGMRRAKSESTMAFPMHRDELEPFETQPKGLKRFDEGQAIYHPIHQTKALSRSVHDLSMRGNDGFTDLRPSSARPSSALQNRPLQRISLSPQASVGINSDSSPNNPPRQRVTSPLVSPRARFADPPIVPEAQQPHGGFSYLFPTAPVASFSRPPSAVAYAQRELLSPSSTHNQEQEVYETSFRPSYTENGQVVYIPINTPDGRKIYKGSSSSSRRQANEDYATESRSSSRQKVRSPSINMNIGEDVREALSQFNYLDEYDNSSLRGNKDREVSYHF
ncbi:hypothetical protein WR25_23220 [Diploscapter pachys]|uniref:GBD/FH3 domain-containing protein n=1 Tax=Diploscapter pachys TaxID=2018661 RepID=A0A2A2JKB3_9BILA|nr:hypothetical protein WR25_23220 [Diploscapter pachys]